MDKATARALCGAVEDPGPTTSYHTAAEQATTVSAWDAHSQATAPDPERTNLPSRTVAAGSSRLRKQSSAAVPSWTPEKDFIGSKMHHLESDVWTGGRAFATIALNGVL